jgi:hypothetical protein
MKSKQSPAAPGGGPSTARPPVAPIEPGSELSGEQAEALLLGQVQVPAEDHHRVWFGCDANELTEEPPPEDEARRHLEAWAAIAVLKDKFRPGWWDAFELCQRLGIGTPANEWLPFIAAGMRVRCGRLVTENELVGYLFATGRVQNPAEAAALTLEQLAGILRSDWADKPQAVPEGVPPPATDAPTAKAAASQLVEVIDALCARIDATAGLAPCRTQEDYEELERLWGRVAGLTAAAGLRVDPPPLEDAGLLVHERVNWHGNWVYRPHSGQNFRPPAAWESRMRTLRAAAAAAAEPVQSPPLPPTRSATVFARLKDGRYRLRFAGAEDTLPGYKGLQVIEYLLKQPGKEAHVLKLNEYLNGDGRGNSHRRRRKLGSVGGEEHPLDEHAEEEEVGADELGPCDPDRTTRPQIQMDANSVLDAADDADLQRAQAQLAERQEWLREAEELGDSHRAAELEKEVRALQKWLAEQRELRRMKAKHWTSSSGGEERVRKKLHQCVVGSYDKLTAAGFGDLRQHLEASMHYANRHWKYAPDPTALPVDWCFAPPD